jgi:DNA-binding PadR family transcriptional regulator
MRRNQTDFVLLGLLAIESSQSGYDLRRMIQGSVGYFWGESFGQIYPALQRLTREGLIVESGARAGAKAPGKTRSKKKAAGAKERRAYSITTEGHARLTEWLAMPYRLTPPRDEFLLKLFFGGAVGAPATERKILEFQENNRQVLATLEEIGRLSHERNGQHPDFPYWILTLEYGVAEMRAQLAWSERALEVVRGIDTAKTRAARDGASAGQSRKGRAK